MRSSKLAHRGQVTTRNARIPAPAMSTNRSNIVHLESVGMDCCWTVQVPLVSASPKLVEASGMKTTQASVTPLGAVTTAAHGVLFSVTSGVEEIRSKRASLSAAACGLVPVCQDMMMTFHDVIIPLASVLNTKLSTREFRFALE